MELHPPVEPYRSGLLPVGDAQHVYWEECGNPNGLPVLVLHGGPGSGCTPLTRRLIDPATWRIVLLDQRGCGRSVPNASDPAVDLSANTTPHLVADLEALRSKLGIDAWLVWGASWGTTLALAYVQTHPDRVLGMLLAGVVLTSHAEVAWVTRSMGRIFPQAWERFVAEVPEPERDGDLATAYSRLLNDPDPVVRERAAAQWCAWEDTHVATYPGHRPDPRYDDPAFRMTFARLVTHYWSHAGFLDDGALLAGMPTIAHIPAVLVHGELDVSAPPDIPWRLARRWPAAEFRLVPGAGHGGRAWTDAVLAATADLAWRVPGPSGEA